MPLLDCDTRRMYPLYDFSQAYRLVHGQVEVVPGTLADTDETRDGRICRDIAQPWLRFPRGLHRDESLSRERSATVSAFGWATLDRCRSLFPWCQFRRQSAGKLQPRLDVLAAFRPVFG